MNTHEDFRNCLSEERENLTRLSDYWNSQAKCNSSISKEDQGRIRAAVGKTRLLLAEKFKQFEGLVEQSENNTSEKIISINDLQGFWDLVLIQVNEIKETFRSLNSCGEKNNLGNSGKPKSPDPEQKEINKTRSLTKKKYSNDYIDRTEKKLREISEKTSERTDAKDLKRHLIKLWMHFNQNHYRNRSDPPKLLPVYSVPY